MPDPAAPRLAAVRRQPVPGAVQRVHGIAGYGHASGICSFEEAAFRQMDDSVPVLVPAVVAQAAYKAPQDWLFIQFALVFLKRQVGAFQPCLIAKRHELEDPLLDHVAGGTDAVAVDTIEGQVALDGSGGAAFRDVVHQLDVLRSFHPAIVTAKLQRQIATEQTGRADGIDDFARPPVFQVFLR